MLKNADCAFTSVALLCSHRKERAIKKPTHLRFLHIL